LSTTLIFGGSPKHLKRTAEVALYKAIVLVKFR
jgi:hypothetical protein